jgi:hypothetical protein
VTANWAGDGAKLNGKVMGINPDASFAITDKAVQGESTDPGMLLRGQAKAYLDSLAATQRHAPSPGGGAARIGNQSSAS